MPLLPRISGKLRGAMSRRQLEADTDAELAVHLELKQKQLEAQGVDPVSAARQARYALGNAAVWKERMLDTWSFSGLERLWRELTFGGRVLAKEKVFTTVVVLMLALGIGATTAIFTLINGLLVRALPVERPDQLVRIVLTNLPPTDRYWQAGRATRPKERRDISYPLYEALTRRQQFFSGVFGLAANGHTVVETNGVPHRVFTSHVTGSFFPVLGVRAQAGRLLAQDDDVPGGPESGWHAVISDVLWERLFGRAAHAVGSRITVERIPFTVVGVTPASFQGVRPGVEVDLWTPLSAMEAMYPDFEWRANRGAGMIQAMARRRPGVSLEQAHEHLEALSRPLLEESKELTLTAEGEKHFLAMKLDTRSAQSGDSQLAATYGRVLWILMVAVGAVLLIASVNVTNLLLARSTARRHEIAVRLAIGASASRIRRQFLIESLLLAIGGVVSGIALSRWLIVVFQSSISSRSSAVNIDAPIDLTVFGFVALVLCVVTVVCGWAPASLASRVPVHGTLQQRSPGMRTLRLRRSLVIVQTALAFALLGGAGLLLASFRELMRESTGFQANETVLLTPDLFNAGIDREHQARVYHNLLNETRRQPKVVAAAWTMTQPLSGGLLASSVEIPGFSELPPNSRMFFRHQISDGYFAALGIPMLAGADLSAAVHARRHMCVVSENAARRFFGSVEGAVGRRIRPKNLPWLEIVGVAADAKYQHIREPEPMTLYTPYWDETAAPGMTLAIRHTAGLAPLLANMRTLFRKEVGRVPFIQTATIAENLSESVRTERVLMTLLTGFASFALLISAVGVAGLLSYTVQQRRKEIGIRLALGAPPAEIRRRVQLQAVVLSGTGLALGGGLSYALHRALDSYLFRTTASDPVIWLSVAATLTVSSVLAATLPAWRAARVDPAQALRLQ